MSERRHGEKELREGRSFFESGLSHFPDNTGQVAKFVALLHDVITAA